MYGLSVAKFAHVVREYVNPRKLPTSSHQPASSPCFNVLSQDPMSDYATELLRRQLNGKSWS
jgi:hypothetical protein